MIHLIQHDELRHPPYIQIQNKLYVNKRTLECRSGIFHIRLHAIYLELSVCQLNASCKSKCDLKSAHSLPAAPRKVQFMQEDNVLLIEN